MRNKIPLMHCLELFLSFFSLKVAIRRMRILAMRPLASSQSTYLHNRTA